MEQKKHDGLQTSAFDIPRKPQIGTFMYSTTECIRANFELLFCKDVHKQPTPTRAPVYGETVLIDSHGIGKTLSHPISLAVVRPKYPATISFQLFFRTPNEQSGGVHNLSDTELGSDSLMSIFKFPVPECWIISMNGRTHNYPENEFTVPKSITNFLFYVFTDYIKSGSCSMGKLHDKLPPENFMHTESVQPHADRAMPCVV